MRTHIPPSPHCSLPATTVFFHFITPSVSLFAGLSSLNRAQLNTPNSPTLLVCIISLKMSHSFKWHPWFKASKRLTAEEGLMQTTESHPCLGAPLLPLPMASAALQQYTAYAVMMNMVLLVNGTQAGTVWRGRDRQLCVSNASSRNWVTLVSHHFGIVRLFHLLLRFDESFCPG